MHKIAVIAFLLSVCATICLQDGKINPSSEVAHASMKASLPSIPPHGIFRRQPMDGHQVSVASRRLRPASRLDAIDKLLLNEEHFHEYDPKMIRGASSMQSAGQEETSDESSSSQKEEQDKVSVPGDDKKSNNGDISVCAICLCKHQMVNHAN